MEYWKGLVFFYLLYYNCFFSFKNCHIAILLYNCLIIRIYWYGNSFLNCHNLPYIAMKSAKLRPDVQSATSRSSFHDTYIAIYYTNMSIRKKSWKVWKRNWLHWTEKYSLNLRRRLRKRAKKKTKKQQIT